ncbi:hypothetical protein B0J12DRAFT_445453 [Macrophomina phaseolina]|uniref:Zn(2)-C6 fungal-type domain-containing protein n=1 Tax=Macrophomina phaseolina TaxID=35725 RepID=A0ABQ8FQN4_9PEZI|nr:hypothetical protein B0J12DRAFT_445453 [Macrophomina phaseolina]
MSDGASTDKRTRTRVGKACDRCRRKKSKCNGLSPCTRCQREGFYCVFSERSKSRGRVYPKGYAESLEQHQIKLLAGVQELYRRLKEGEGWLRAPLPEQESGYPLTHDILARLGLLQLPKSSNQLEPIEEESMDALETLRDAEQIDSDFTLQPMKTADFRHVIVCASSPVFTGGNLINPPVMHCGLEFSGASNSSEVAIAPEPIDQPVPTPDLRLGNSVENIKPQSREMDRTECHDAVQLTHMLFEVDRLIMYNENVTTISYPFNFEHIRWSS